MLIKTIRSCLLLGVILCSSGYAADELSTSAAKPGELEALYTAAIERRTSDILDALELSDPVKASEVRNVIVNQYRALRARDAVIDAYLRGKGEVVGAAAEAERAALTAKFSGPLHDMYVDTLSAYLTPGQVETVKDKMTYNKVQVTYDAYRNIFPNLTETEKAMILEVLKSAREEAISGGSAGEKHAIFDRYKEKINAQLKSNGHDVEKAFSEWEAKQALAADAEAASGGTSN